MTGPRADARAVALVALGGAVGSLARYGLATGFPTEPETFPTTIIAVNLTGALALGLLLGWLARSRPLDEVLRPLLGVGFLGGYTTYSTFSLDVALLVRHDDAVLAVMTVLLSVGGGLALARLGIRLTGTPVGRVNEGES